jgi:uncharacterized damage-inducible protein DinB
MSRFDGWDPPAVGMQDSPRLVSDWSALRAARSAADMRIADWAARLTAVQLAAPLTWFSAVVQREARLPLWVTVGHFFNHQTHHRGQAHALLTRAGAATGDTDLPWVVDLPTLGIAS